LIHSYAYRLQILLLLMCRIGGASGVVGCQWQRGDAAD